MVLCPTTFRSYDGCVTYYQGMLALSKRGVPVPKLYAQKTGDYLFTTKAGQGQPVYLIVMEYFEGKDFLAQPPSTQDIVALLSYLDKIHHTPFKAPEVYDPWEPQFLVGEFEKNRELLPDEDRKLVEPIVSAARTLDLKVFKKGLIHADLMRNNCIKNDQGQYCLLDFGVLAQNHIIIDTAIFIAGFCLDPLKANITENQKMYDFAVRTYKDFDTQPVDKGYFAYIEVREAKSESAASSISSSSSLAFSTSTLLAPAIKLSSFIKGPMSLLFASSRCLSKYASKVIRNLFERPKLLSIVTLISSCNENSNLV